MRSCLIILIIISVSTNAFAQTYNLVGNSESIGGDCYRLTSDYGNQRGVIWYSDKINLAEHFDIEFRMNFGTADTYGADGMVFIMQTVDNQALGNSGGDLGFAGFSPSLGVEFDTFQNTINDFGFNGDPAFDHIAVISNGSVNHSAASSLVKPVQALLNNPNIEDGKEHLIRITWEPSTNLLEVYFDCQKRISFTKNIMNDIFNGQSSVFWGFSGSTGLFTNNQTVCLSKQILFNNLYTICPGQSVNLIGRTSSDNVYKWTPSGGLNNSSIRTPVANPKKTTTYVVSYKNYCGLPVNDTVKVIVPVSDVNLGNDTTLCVGSVLLLNPAVANAGYQWQDGSRSPTYTVRRPGSYSVAITYNNCVIKSSITIDYASKLNVNLGKDTLLCIGAKLLLSPKILGATYQWQDGSTGPTKEVSMAGIFSVNVSANGCYGSDTLKVEYAKPLVSPLGPDTTICKGQTIELQINQPRAQVVWNDNTTGPVHRINQPGLIWAKIQVNGCTTTDSIIVKQKPDFTFRLGNDIILCAGDSTLLKLPIGAPGSTKFTWSTGDIGIPIKIDRAGYTWLESDLGDCIFRDSLLIIVVPCNNINIYVPDAFSPDGNGINEVFKPIFSQNTLTDYLFIIYTQWGDVIYMTQDLSNGWDGSYKGGTCIAGVYTYRINYSYIDNNATKSYKKLGRVLLIR